MRAWFPSFVLMFSFFTVTGTAQAKNPCGCKPIPSTKIYQGDARKKHFIGYSIDWSCTYRCKIDSRDVKAKEMLVKAFYHEYHLLPEDGSEGVCEGMVYQSHFNPLTNQEVYMYSGEDKIFSPSDSSSLNLKKWAEANFCS